jgi:succinyl-CoA synthetase beta subunit
MARLIEYHGKQLLAARGIAVPEGELCQTPDEARAAADRLARPVVIKSQVFETNRAGAGGVSFDIAKIPACPVLVEERIPIAREFYAAFVVDDRLRRAMLMFGGEGGTGVEQRAGAIVRLPVSVTEEPPRESLEAMARQVMAPPSAADVLLRLWQTARAWEARSLEINPLALTPACRWVALDCRMAVDDYAVFRHPELGIDVARELGHPPTELERVAWKFERDDYRGTFYFIETPPIGDGIPIGFQGAGGGGSMAGLDAAAAAGLVAADFTDTSGNPPASKVYRAARIILSLPGIRGYFLTGPGVASQEQFHFARALVKAFREHPLRVPAVLRLGGNGEELALAIIRRYAEETDVAVEAYGAEAGAEFCAARLRELIVASTLSAAAPPVRNVPEKPYSFATRTGTITYDHAVCTCCESKACVSSCGPGILSTRDGLPVLNISLDDARRGRCIECLACEVECWYQGAGGARIDLPCLS